MQSIMWMNNAFFQRLWTLHKWVWVSRLINPPWVYIPRGWNQVQRQSAEKTAYIKQKIYIYEIIFKNINITIIVLNTNGPLCFSIAFVFIGKKKKISVSPVYLYSKLRARPITRRRTSLVPAPISYSFASLRSLPVA